jgi:hypothetical protein
VSSSSIKPYCNITQDPEVLHLNVSLKHMELTLRHYFYGTGKHIEIYDIKRDEWYT